MKVSDYVIDFLVQRGVNDIFTVSGGGIMHLVDSLGRRPGVRYICNFHEQACAIAAEAYARVRNSVGACLVTTGPGSTNALSGIAGAFVDSVPVIVISGQVRRDIIADYRRLRQLGPQEIDIESMARPVVKYFKTLMDPAMLRYELECAWWHATTGRPGPTWINIPLDVQGMEFEEEGSPRFQPPPTVSSSTDLKAQVAEVIEMLRAAERPVVIGGNGIHLGGAHDGFERFVEKVGAPVLSTIGGLDLLDESHALYMGRFGPTGQRRANFTLQNSDLLITIGASMSISSIGFNTSGFAPKAKRIMITNDSNDLAKPNFKPDLGVAADANLFFAEFLSQCNDEEFRFCTALEGGLHKVEGTISHYYPRLLRGRGLREQLRVCPGSFGRTRSGRRGSRRKFARHCVDSTLLQCKEGPTRVHEYQLWSDGLGPPRRGGRLCREW